MTKCIYCLGDCGPFDTEHVISEAFGKFENNLTLVGFVRKGCNKHFGDKLEFVFTRDSIEAFDRVVSGLKANVDIGDLPQRRLNFVAAFGDEFDGLRLSLAHEAGERVVTLVPQVGLRKQQGAGWAYLTEGELGDSQRELPANVERSGPIRVIGEDEQTIERLIGLLKARGLPFNRQGTFVPPGPGDDRQIPVYITTQIDPLVKRCVAKYAFNYLARMTDREFVLRSDFDVVRKFIRYGEAPSYSLVEVDGRPILAKDTRTRRQTEGHLVTASWAADNRSIVGQVSLFNRLTYRVSLARNFTGLWRPLQFGHHYDLVRRRVDSMTATRLMVPLAQLPVL